MPPRAHKTQPKRYFDPFRLTKEEKAIEDSLMRGEYKPVSKSEFRRVKRLIAEKAAELERG